MPLESTRTKKEVPTGVWAKCPKCEQIIYNKELHENLKVCPKCQHHFRLNSKERLELLLDEKSFRPFAETMEPKDPLEFTDLQPYKLRIAQAQKKTGLKDSCVAGSATIEGQPLMVVNISFEYMGGSMGSVVGEKIAIAAEKAIETKVPLMIISASGGARMQESIFSLMQMAKTSAALARLSEAHLPFISLITDPTTGGVTASFAMLGDIIIAEPGALIAFAGPRVIEQTIRQQLPEGFQLSEFLLKHGMLDMIVHRKDLKSTLAKLLRHLN